MIIVCVSSYQFFNRNELEEGGNPPMDHVIDLSLGMLFNICCI